MERIPVIVVLGHVDHGKTTLLDAIRNTSVQKREPSGITQNIYISEVEYKGKKLTFVDTPGHEVFSLMRSQGGKVADVALLIVAADEGVKPQTLESLEIIKNEHLKFIVVITKIDTQGADVNKVKTQLASRGVYVEGFGGDTPVVEVSAVKKQGIDKLLETIFLYLEVENVLDDEAIKLKLLEFIEDESLVEQIEAYGIILDSTVHKALGRLGFTILRYGTFEKGDEVFIGENLEHISRFLDPDYKPIKELIPGQAFILAGLENLPISGDLIVKIKDKKAYEQYLNKLKTKTNKAQPAQALNPEDFLEQLFEEEPEKTFIPFILKTDVEASLRSVLPTIEKFNTEDIELKKVFAGVGDITPNDVDLAKAYKAKLIGFRVKTNKKVEQLAREHKVELTTFKTVYQLYDYISNLIKQIQQAHKGPEIIGKAKVLKTFILSDKSIVAGSVVLEGVVKRKANVRIIRDKDIIAELPIADLKILKDRVDKVEKGKECGINLGKDVDVKQGDILEVVE